MDTLGSITQSLVDRAAPQQAKCLCINDALRDLLPGWLLSHCEIAGIKDGRLAVRVDHPAECFELRTRGLTILDGLRAKCPAARITRIDFTLL